MNYTSIAKKLLAVSAVALIVAACAKKQEAAPPPPPPPPPKEAPPPPPPPPPGPAKGSLEDMIATVGSDRVHFAYDSSELSEEAQTTLAAEAKWLADNPTVQLTIEGHCDERGTREYNLALGDRRATAVRDFLASQGVSADRMKTISYGKERPVDPASNEEAWAKNRRGMLVPSS